MKRSLEVALKDALSDASTRLDTEAAVARLTSTAYRGQSRRWLGMPGVGGAAGLRRAVSATGVTLIAAIVTTILLLSSGGNALVPLAYAGWSAVPQTPTPAEVARAARLCNHKTVSYQPAPTSDRPTLTDKRGRYVAILSAGGRTTQLCISDGRAADTRGGSSFGQVLTGRAQLGFPAVGIGGPLPGFEGSDDESNLYGRAAPDIREVTIVFAGGRSVQATVENGWYFAWWPNSDHPVAIRAQRASRTITMHLG
jgi:hypothetical protein